MFKILAFFIIMLYARLYVRVGISLTCGKHLHNRIICLRGLILPLSIEVSVAIQESGSSCMCVLGISIMPLFTIFLLDFGTVPIEWYFLFLLYFLSQVLT